MSDLNFKPMPLNPENFSQSKRSWIFDGIIAHLTGSTEDEIRALRKKLNLIPSYRLVDTCAAEFEAYTPYYYSTTIAAMTSQRQHREKK